MNILEGFRVVFSIVLVAAALFAALNATQGGLALPRPMRPRITFRRRAQMISLIIAGTALGIQSIIVAMTPNPLEPSYTVYTSNISILVALMALIGSVGIHLWGWWREGTIMKVPLDPDAEEKAREAVLRAREIAHTSRTAMSLLTIILSDLEEDPMLSKDKRKNIREALQGIADINMKIARWHEEIKILQPEIMGDIDVTKDTN